MFETLVIAGLAGCVAGFVSGLAWDMLREKSLMFRMAAVEEKIPHLYQSIASEKGVRARETKKEVEAELTEQELAVVGSLAQKAKAYVEKCKAEGAPIDKGFFLQLGLEAIGTQPSLFRHKKELQKILSG